MFNFSKKGKKGFTLIELLVVIAIIGILASVVLASLNSARKKSRDARRLSDIKQIQVALEFYFDSNNSAYPADIYDTTNGLAGASACGSGNKCMPSVPTDPLDATVKYVYEPLSSETSYVLSATLEEDTNPALDNDIDGTVGTTACGATPEVVATGLYYCVQP